MSEPLNIVELKQLEAFSNVGRQIPEIATIVTGTRRAIVWTSLVYELERNIIDCSLAKELFPDLVLSPWHDDRPYRAKEIVLDLETEFHSWKGAKFLVVARVQIGSRILLCRETALLFLSEYQYSLVGQIRDRSRFYISNMIWSQLPILACIHNKMEKVRTTMRQTLVPGKNYLFSLELTSIGKSYYNGKVALFSPEEGPIEEIAVKPTSAIYRIENGKIDYVEVTNKSNRLIDLPANVNFKVEIYMREIANLSYAKIDTVGKTDIMRKTKCLDIETNVEIFSGFSRVVTEIYLAFHRGGKFAEEFEFIAKENIFDAQYVPSFSPINFPTEKMLNKTYNVIMVPRESGPWSFVVDCTKRMMEDGEPVFSPLEYPLGLNPRLYLLDQAVGDIIHFAQSLHESWFYDDLKLNYVEGGVRSFLTSYRVAVSIREALRLILFRSLSTRVKVQKVEKGSSINI